MNNDFDFASKRTMLILLFICLMFCIIISKAFDYLPDKSDTATVDNTRFNEMIAAQNARANVIPQNQKINKNIPVDEEQRSQRAQENKNIEQQEEAQQTEIELDEPPITVQPITEKQPNPEESLTLIDDSEILEETIVDSSENATEDVKNKTSATPEEKIAKARSLTQTGDLQGALELYKDITNEIKDLELSASCYEEMSNIYAYQKRYGSALIYAQKAYNASPSPSRESLITKLREKLPQRTN